MVFILEEKIMGWSNNMPSSSTSTPQQPVATTSGAESPASALSAGGDLTVTDSGAINRMAEVVTAALQAAGQAGQAFLNTVSDLAQNQTAAGATSQAGESALLTQVLASQSDLAKQVQSSGQSDQNKLLLYLGLGLLAVIGVIFYTRR
jgi:hypothetical protein